MPSGGEDESTPHATGVIAVTTATLFAACSNDPSSPEYDPDIPAVWASAVTNEYYPLLPGTTYHFEGETPEGVETITIEVLSQTRTIQGVLATRVHDRAFLDGELIEDTEDWFAQDEAGNVWYLGEDTKEYEGGQVVSTAGSWEWGVDGALPGIIMWADPSEHIGEEYRQEFARGEAEDFGKVVAVEEDVEVPEGRLQAASRPKIPAHSSPIYGKTRTTAPISGSRWRPTSTVASGSSW